MKQSEIKKYYTLLSLYLAQSIPMSFFSTVIPVIMRMENYSLESIGYIQLIKLPWILKMLWAPMVDKTSKNKRHYRRWIIMSEAFYALIIMSVGYLNLQTDFTTIIILMVIAFTASATQDIATDAFAILILNKNERSLGNSMQSAGCFIGTMLGSTKHAKEKKPIVQQKMYRLWSLFTFSGRKKLAPTFCCSSCFIQE